MNELVVFPSVEWFERLAAEMRANEKAFRELGPVDCVTLVKIDRDHAASELFEITFAAYGVQSIRELVRLSDASPSHFVLEADFRTWREMIENIRANGGPDLEHTLNYLTLPDVPMRVTGPDQLEIDTFYRYNETLQRFFNGAATFVTAYADGRVAPLRAVGQRANGRAVVG